MTDYDLDIFARTLYGEARGEYAYAGPAALIAVANVIMNRFKRGKKYGKTITEVCLKPRQFSCWNKSDSNRTLIQQEEITHTPLFILCEKIVQKVSRDIWPDLTRDSDHYHATSCQPYWAKPEKIKLRLGHHIFYKLD
ncbi:MAG: cell wall hydrolase [Proteobacteria bacterium]|nr:cell wall hydrolase [Pseudomonadota bacterium]